jgi:hypothetical protein
MGFLKDLFSGGASTLVDSVGKVLDNVITTKEEKLQLENEIAKSEMQFQLDMKKLTNEEQQMLLNDVSNARQREVQVLSAPNASWWTKNTMHVLGIGTCIITLSLFYVLIFRPELVKDSSGKEVIMYILGVLSAILTQIYSYYFGSSAGSAAKSLTIAGKLDKQ